MTRTFKDLIAWQKAHKLTLDIYDLSKNFPTSEMYGLTAQLRKSAVAIGANIMEGHKRATQQEFAHYVNIAHSALEETIYLLLLAHDLKYLKPRDYSRLNALADETGKLLYGFEKKLRAE